MIQEPKKRRGANVFFYAISFVLATIFIAAVTVLVITVVEAVRELFTQATPTVSFESLNRELLKLIETR